MAWTAPRTWVTGELVTATLGNEQWRDNMKWLGGADGRGATLPASPLDGQLFVYVADDTNGIEWLLKYKSATSRWRKVGGPTLEAVIETEETTTSTAFTDLATVGPSKVAPLAGVYDITHICEAQVNVADEAYISSVRIGATAAAESDRAFGHSPAASKGATIGVTVRKTVAVNDTIKQQYRVGSGTGGFGRRKLYLDPIYVTA